MDRIYSANVDSVDLKPVADFEGATLLEGDPNWRFYALVEGSVERGTPGTPLLSGVLTSEPAKWTYMFESNETLHVLEGEVRVELDNGDAVELGPGDIAHVPKGHLTTWTVKTPLKELFVLHN